MMSHDIGRRKNGATLKLWPGMTTTLGLIALARAIARQKSCSTSASRLNSSTSLAHAWMRTRSAKATPRALSASSCCATSPMRAPERATFTTRACGNAAASRPAVDSVGSAPTPNAVLSPATTIVRLQHFGHDSAGTVRATMRREKRMREA